MDYEEKVRDQKLAEELLANPVWKRIWERMSGYLETKELSCDTTDSVLAADIIRCKQLLNGLEREVHKVITEGKAAKIRLKEIEKKTLKEVVFRR